MSVAALETPTTRRATDRLTRGFFEIGVINGKSQQNIGTLWRSAFQLGACGIFTVGQRYEKSASDTVQAARHVPFRRYEDFDGLLAYLPEGTPIVAVEMGGRNLWNFVHPARAIYLLGAEDRGVPQTVLDRCQHIVSLEAVRTASYNVAMAGSIVMYHRLMQRNR